MRPDLLVLDASVLAELTNPGVVRRAVKELDAGARFEFSVVDDAVVARDDQVECVLGAGEFGTWTCTCPTGERCRHLVRAVLDWQRQNPPDERVEPSESAAPGMAVTTGTVVTASAVGSAGSGGESVLPPGTIAAVSLGERPRVRLLHPDHVAVRFLVGSDPRYARCECGQAGCAHVPVAASALVHPPDPDTGLVTAGAVPVVVREQWVQEWHGWVARLWDLGLPAAGELMAGAVRLASGAERDGLAHPAAVLREIAEQLELRLDHSSRLSPVRLVELIGEVEARVRALVVGVLPGALVAGSRSREVPSSMVRLVGLGADYRQVGGWHELRAYVADTGTGAVRTVTLTRTDTDDTQFTAAALAQVRKGGPRMLDWAAGRGLLRSARRVGDELVPPRGRWSMQTVMGLEVDPATFSPVVAGLGLPSVLGPRRPADAVGLVEVRSVVGVTEDAGSVAAQLACDDGDVTARLAPDPRAGRAAQQLAEVWRGRVTAVAGRWRSASEVIPTAVWFPGGVALPQLGVVVRSDEVDEALADESHASTLADPWTGWWAELGEVLGRVLTTGARRGASGGLTALRECGARADALGLARGSALVTALVATLPSPHERVDPLLDAALLLSMAHATPAPDATDLVT